MHIPCEPFCWLSEVPFLMTGQTVDGQNPAPGDMVNAPLSGGAGFLPSTDIWAKCMVNVCKSTSPMDPVVGFQQKVQGRV